MIKVHTDLSVDVLRQMNRHVFSKIAIKVLIMNLIFIPIAIVAGVMLKDRSSTILTIVCSIVIGVVDLLFVGVYILTQVRAKKFAQMNATYDFDFGTEGFDVVITKQGLNYTLSENYANIRRVYETKKLILLQKNEMQYYAVNKDQIDESNLIMLRSLLRARVRGKLKSTDTSTKK